MEFVLENKMSENYTKQTTVQVQQQKCSTLQKETTKKVLLQRGVFAKNSSTLSKLTLIFFSNDKKIWASDSKLRKEYFSSTVSIALVLCTKAQERKASEEREEEVEETKLQPKVFLNAYVPKENKSYVVRLLPRLL